MHQTSWARVERIGGIATVTLAAPHGINRINVDSARDWLSAVDCADTDPATRLIVIRAEGQVWNVGGDLSVMRGDPAEVARTIDQIGAFVNPLAHRLHTSPRVTIAAVHGAVAGGAVGLMSACDLVVAADDVVITQGYSRLGVNPDAGVSWFLVRQLGYRKAFELYLTSDRLDANEAAGLGLVSRVVPAGELAAQTAELAHRIAALSPRATAEAKRLFRSALDNALDVHLDAEIRAFSCNTLQPDFAEGVTAFHQRRDPVFI